MWSARAWLRSLSSASARVNTTLAGAHRGGPEALDQKRLADADGSDEEDVLLALQELQAEHVLELVAIEVHR